LRLYFLICFFIFVALMKMRVHKETMLKQHARVFWMCGLSGAGKSTLAASLDRELTSMGYMCLVIDGDDIRKGLNKSLGFSDEDRRENLRRVAEVARLTTNNGIITIVSFITPTRSIREMIRTILSEDYIEVFVNAPIGVCELRDTKGLYRQAREGKIREFTGIDSPFEIPNNPDLEIDTEKQDIEQSSQRLIDFVLPMIEYK
jgi:adenylyl-sulfate kinase